MALRGAGESEIHTVAITPRTAAAVARCHSITSREGTTTTAPGADTAASCRRLVGTTKLEGLGEAEAAGATLTTQPPLVDSRHSTTPTTARMDEGAVVAVTVMTAATTAGVTVAGTTETVTAISGGAGTIEIAIMTGTAIGKGTAAVAGLRRGAAVAAKGKGTEIGRDTVTGKEIETAIVNGIGTVTEIVIATGTKIATAGEATAIGTATEIEMATGLPLGGSVTAKRAIANVTAAETGTEATDEGMIVTGTEAGLQTAAVVAGATAGPIEEGMNPAAGAGTSIAIGTATERGTETVTGEEQAGTPDGEGTGTALAAMNGTAASEVVAIGAAASKGTMEAAGRRADRRLGRAALAQVRGAEEATAAGEATALAAVTPGGGGPAGGLAEAVADRMTMGEGSAGGPAAATIASAKAGEKEGGDGKMAGEKEVVEAAASLGAGGDLTTTRLQRRSCHRTLQPVTCRRRCHHPPAALLSAPATIQCRTIREATAGEVETSAAKVAEAVAGASASAGGAAVEEVEAAEERANADLTRAAALPRHSTAGNAARAAEVDHVRGRDPCLEQGSVRALRLWMVGLVAGGGEGVRCSGLIGASDAVLQLWQDNIQENSLWLAMLLPTATAFVVWTKF
mmetsp:Transcript_28076/g.82601  ORF Transcript_28076/g.82601 Transcript_28076/m.82601 type:complete len:627 (+) Transcript_28076:1175-3055(+)